MIQNTKPANFFEGALKIQKERTLVRGYVNLCDPNVVRKPRVAEELNGHVVRALTVNQETHWFGHLLI